MIRGKDALLLDGECGLCNKVAIFVNKRKSLKKEIDYLSIESEEAQELIAKFTVKQKNADTVYLLSLIHI